MQYVIETNDSNKRLDLFVVSLALAISRSKVNNLISDGNILVNNGLAKSSYKLKVGDKISIEIPPPPDLTAIPQELPLDIVYEDDQLIVVNKARGMVVHPAVGNHDKTLVNALLFHAKNLSDEGENRPGIVHRLDKDTSGLMVVAKNNFAHQNLSNQFKEHEVVKIYSAIVCGWPKDDEFLIELPIGRHPVDRKKMAVVTSFGRKNHKGRVAKSLVKVVKRFEINKEKFSLVDVQIFTGRTHQIRVHLSYMGYPIVGDEVYGKRNTNFQCPISPAQSGIQFPMRGQLLHSRELRFVHPTTGKEMRFEAKLPKDMDEFLNNCS